MAEQGKSTALVPLNGEYLLEIKDFNAAGSLESFKVPIPSSVTAQEASVMLRAAILKRTTWKDRDFPTVLHAVMYADRMGLDIMAGDVYMADEGRISTTAGAKIRHAIGTGRIVGYTVTITDGPQIAIDYQLKGQAQQYKGPNLKAAVKVWVKDWKDPVTYETTLAEWFTGRNPNWRSRPAYMLRKNALSKAFEEVAPMGVEADEAPPLIEVEAPRLALEAAKAAVQSEGEK